MNKLNCPIVKNEIIMQLHNLSFAYPGEQAILEQINLDIYQNDFLVMIGPNGSAKTTLLKIMLGLLKPQQGTITMGNAPRKRPTLSYLPQKAQINHGFPATVWEVLFFAKNKHKNSQDISAVLTKVDLAHKKNALLGTLSGGQLQRVFLARALLNDPDMIFLDEPTNNLDIQAQQELYQLLAALHEEGLTIITVTHDLTPILQYATRIITVGNKKISEMPRDKWKEE
jgi:zinc transport system ATP-binding protein